MNLSDSPRRAPARAADRLGESHTNSAADRLSLLRLINVVLRSRGLVAGTALAVAAAVVAGGLLRARTYSSGASFVPQGRVSGSNLSGIAAQFGIAVAGGDGTQSPQFYVDLISSRAVLGDVADRTFSFETDTGRAVGTIADFYAITARTPGLRREMVIDLLRQRVSAGVSPKTGVITLTVTTQHAPLSYQIADRIVARINTFNLESRQSQAAGERRFTEQRLNEVKADLRAAENRLQNFLQRNRQFRNSPELQFEEERLTREVSMRQQLFTSLAQAYEQAKIDEVRDTPVITVIEHPEIPVRPDRRLLIQKGILGLVVGTLLGLGIVLVRHFVLSNREAEPDDVEEFAVLRRAAIDDLIHPWRPVVRLLRSRGAASL